MTNRKSTKTHRPVKAAVDAPVSQDNAEPDRKIDRTLGDVKASVAKIAGILKNGTRPAGV
jgi:hypothetical protein